MIKKNKRVVVLLGMPRSGTTWLGKIIDSHPNVMYRHEPDSEIHIAVPLLNVKAVEHVEEIRRFYQNLAMIRTAKTCGKRPFFKKAYFNVVTAYLFKASVLITKILERIYIKVPVIEIVSYSDGPVTLLWKSIESIGRLGAIMSIDPCSKMIFLVRHPCGQIASIVSGERNHAFTADISSAEDYGVYEQLLATEFAKSRHIDMQTMKSLTMIQRLAWRWVLYNEAALADLQAYQDRGLVVFYDELCAYPIETSKSIFAFLGLDWHRQTTEFINESVSSNNSSYYSVYKDPKSSSQNWKSKLSNSEIGAIKEIVMQSEHLRQYFPEQVE